MSALISSQELAARMASDQLFAVFDVRERGEYNEGQIPGATSLPRSQIEFRIQSLVPDWKISLMLYDGADGRAELAAKTLDELGYSEVSILEGGLPAWRKEGRQTVSGVNVPSKAFGEKVHHERNIPDVTSAELKTLCESGNELLILDVRTPEEYGRFCIPGGLNRSAVLHKRFAKVSEETSDGLESRWIEPDAGISRRRRHRGPGSGNEGFAPSHTPPSVDWRSIRPSVAR